MASVPPIGNAEPTATHADVEVHATPRRSTPDPGSEPRLTAELGLGEIVHELPSHISMVLMAYGVVSKIMSPTATQNDAVTHDTEERLFWSPGLVTGTSVHVPSASTYESRPFPISPTATQLVVDGHDMDVSRPWSVDSVQEEPSHWSMKSPTPPSPTATQKEVEAHDTPLNSAFEAVASGLANSDQDVPFQVSVTAETVSW